jgi:hypothetical protein
MSTKLISVVLALICVNFTVWSQTEKPRLIVLADMGNEPDEMQQIMQLLMYGNEIDIEGLISVTGIHLHPDKPRPYRSVTHPELFFKLIDGYEKVYANLHRHAEGWISPYNLRVGVCVGQSEYGMGGVGEGKSSVGSNWIIHQVTNEDPRPIYIVINAGSNTLAQALFDYRKDHTKDEMDDFIGKLRVFENGAQGDAGAWINHEFPNIHWIRGIHQTKNFGGPTRKATGPHAWKPFEYSSKGQDNWAHEHIRTNHGALGELYPMRVFFGMTIQTPAFIGGGGIIPWMSLAIKGLTDPSEQSWGGWSGRYTTEKIENFPSPISKVHDTEKQYEPWAVYTDAIDHWVEQETGIEYNDVHTAIWPWRQAMYNDIRARMDWCIKAFDEANHHPIAILNGDASNNIIKKNVKVGDKLSFDASESSDPDNDMLKYFWWIYPEAGQKPYQEELEITNNTETKIDFVIPENAKGKELHLILEVWDKSPIVPLVDYRRVVLFVE